MTRHDEERRPGGAVEALRRALEQETGSAARVRHIARAADVELADAAAVRLRELGYVVHAPGEVCGIVPGARRTDPSTSSQAAERALPRAKAVAGALLRAYALEDSRSDPAHDQHPPGLNADEAASLIELGGGSWRRISDLHAAGLIEPVVAVDAAGERPGVHVTRPGRSGREQVVYRITAAGRKLVESWRSAAALESSAQDRETVFGGTT